MSMTEQVWQQVRMARARVKLHDLIDKFMDNASFEELVEFYNHIRLHEPLKAHDE